MKAESWRNIFHVNFYLCWNVGFLVSRAELSPPRVREGSESVLTLLSLLTAGGGGEA